MTDASMADFSERSVQAAVVVSFLAGFAAGWQANRMRRKFLDWRKKRLQDKLSETQKKIDLS
ncbi:mitoregulin [Vanacampus margaritifer]